eukprot:927677-Rhodomonas_salina.4
MGGPAHVGGESSGADAEHRHFFFHFFTFLPLLSLRLWTSSAVDMVWVRRGPQEKGMKSCDLQQQRADAVLQQVAHHLQVDTHPQCVARARKHRVTPRNRRTRMREPFFSVQYAPEMWLHGS